VQESTLGRVTRNGNPWSTSDARAEGAGTDVLLRAFETGLPQVTGAWGGPRAQPAGRGRPAPPRHAADTRQRGGQKNT